MPGKLIFGDPVSIEQAFGKRGEHRCPKMDEISVFFEGDLRNSGEGSCEIIEVALPITADSREITYSWAMRVEFGETFTVTGLTSCPFCQEQLIATRPEPLSVQLVAD